MGRFVEKIRSGTGGIFYLIGFLVMMAGSLVSLVICVGIVKEVFSPGVAFLSLAIFPVLIVLAPVYALVSWGSWFPIAVVYGIGIVVMVLFGIAGLISGKE